MRGVVSFGRASEWVNVWQCIRGRVNIWQGLGEDQGKAVYACWVEVWQGMGTWSRCGSTDSNARAALADCNWARCPSLHSLPSFRHRMRQIPNPVRSSMPTHWRLCVRVQTHRRATPSATNPCSVKSAAADNPPRHHHPHHNQRPFPRARACFAAPQGFLIYDRREERPPTPDRPPTTPDCDAGGTGNTSTGGGGSGDERQRSSLCGKPAFQAGVGSDRLSGPSSTPFASRVSAGPLGVFATPRGSGAPLRPWPSHETVDADEAADLFDDRPTERWSATRRLYGRSLKLGASVSGTAAALAAGTGSAATRSVTSAISLAPPLWSASSAGGSANPVAGAAGPCSPPTRIGSTAGGAASAAPGGAAGDGGSCQQGMPEFRALVSVFLQLGMSWRKSLATLRRTRVLHDAPPGAHFTAKKQMLCALHAELAWAARRRDGSEVHEMSAMLGSPPPPADSPEWSARLLAFMEW
eukprot:27756-Chlamydomonas_euryale.AAC.1